jgi:SAM-dependent methyltransferase
VDSTIDYYNRLGKQFAARTENVDMRALYEPFLQLVPPGGYILDAGCGSGRDSKAFLDRGYRVQSVDASETMVEIATAITGRPALLMRFQDLSFIEEFDGIWACGSLLHVPRHELHGVLERLVIALKADGVIYMSFKHAEQDEIRDDRLFTNYTEVMVQELIAQAESVQLLRIWTTRDIRPDSGRPDWLNVLLQKHNP